MPKEKRTGEEERILRQLLLDINQIFLFIPRNIAETDDIKQKLKYGLLKYFSLYFATIIIPMMGLVGFVFASVNDERMASEVLMLALHFMELIFPVGAILAWANQSRNLLKLVHILPKIGNEPEDLMEMYKLANLKRKFVFIFLSSPLMLSLNIFNYFTDAYSTGREKTGDARYLSGMFMPLWLPFETNYFPVKQLLFLVYFMVVVFLSPMFMAFIPFLFVFSGWIQCRIRHLIRIMKEVSLSREQDINIVMKNFTAILEYHSNIARVFDLMNDICGLIMLPNIFYAAPAVSLLLTISFEEFNLMVFMQFVSHIVSMYYVSNVIQQIPDAGEELYQAAYDMDWYDMDYRLRRTFLIFFMKVQKPLVPNTILSNLDRPLYMATMKCTYSYFMYLNNSKNE